MLLTFRGQEIAALSCPWEEEQKFLVNSTNDYHIASTFNGCYLVLENKKIIAGKKLGSSVASILCLDNIFCSKHHATISP